MAAAEASIGRIRVTVSLAVGGAIAEVVAVGAPSASDERLADGTPSELDRPRAGSEPLFAGAFSVRADLIQATRAATATVVGIVEMLKWIANLTSIAAHHPEADRTIAATVLRVRLMRDRITA